MASLSIKLLFLLSIGAMIAGTAVTVVNIKILLEARYWSWVLVLSVFFSIIAYVTITLFDTAIPMFNVPFLRNYDEYYTYIQFFSEPILINLTVTILIVMTSLIPDILLIAYENAMEQLKSVKKVVPH